MGIFSLRSKTARLMVVGVAGVGLVLLAAGLAVIGWVYPFETPLAFGLGLACGCLHSAVKIGLIEGTVSRTMAMDGDGAKGLARLHFFGRFAFTAALFALVLLFPQIFGLFGTILGVLSLQLAAVAAHVVLKRRG